MSTLLDQAESAYHREGHIHIRFQSGHELSFPIEGNPRLASATEEDLNAIELSPFGIHWPRLDEDLSFEGILRGNYGQK